MDAVRGQDGEWKVLEFRPDPELSKLDAVHDFCIGRGTYGYSAVRRSKVENTTGKLRKDGAE